MIGNISVRRAGRRGYNQPTSRYTQKDRSVLFVQRESEADNRKVVIETNQLLDIPEFESLHGKMKKIGFMMIHRCGSFLSTHFHFTNAQDHY